MRAPVGVLVAVCLAFMLMDESEAFPSSKEDLSSVELSRPARRLLAVSNDVDRALEQAERLGSGKSTYDHLTAQGTKDPWQTMVTGAKSVGKKAEKASVCWMLYDQPQGVVGA